MARDPAAAARRGVVGQRLLEESAPRRADPARRARRRGSRRCCRASRRCRTSPPCRPTAGPARRRRPGRGARQGQHLDGAAAAEEAGVVAAETASARSSSRGPPRRRPATPTACATAARNGGNGWSTAVASTSAGTGAPAAGTPACRGTDSSTRPDDRRPTVQGEGRVPMRSASGSSRSTARSQRHQPSGTSEPVCRSRSARSRARDVDHHVGLGARPRWCRPVASWKRAEISCSGSRRHGQRLLGEGDPLARSGSVTRRVITARAEAVAEDVRVAALAGQAQRLLTRGRRRRRRPSRRSARAQDASSRACRPTSSTCCEALLDHRDGAWRRRRPSRASATRRRSRKLVSACAIRTWSPRASSQRDRLVERGPHAVHVAQPLAGRGQGEQQLVASRRVGRE